MAIISEFSASFDVKKITAMNNEQRTEEVRVIRNEVQVIVEDNGTDGRLIVDEVVNVFIDVEHHGNGDNQGDGKKSRCPGTSR